MKIKTFRLSAPHMSKKSNSMGKIRKLEAKFQHWQNVYFSMASVLMLM